MRTNNLILNITDKRCSDIAEFFSGQEDTVIDNYKYLLPNTQLNKEESLKYIICSSTKICKLPKIAIASILMIGYDTEDKVEIKVTDIYAEIKKNRPNILNAFIHAFRDSVYLPAFIMDNDEILASVGIMYLLNESGIKLKEPDDYARAMLEFVE